MTRRHALNCAALSGSGRIDDGTRLDRRAVDPSRPPRNASSKSRAVQRTSKRARAAVVPPPGTRIGPPLTITTRTAVAASTVRIAWSICSTIRRLDELSPTLSESQANASQPRLLPGRYNPQGAGTPRDEDADASGQPAEQVGRGCGVGGVHEHRWSRRLFRAGAYRSGYCGVDEVSALIRAALAKALGQPLPGSATPSPTEPTPAATDTIPPVSRQDSDPSIVAGPVAEDSI